MATTIYYRNGYKYQLAATYQVQIPLLLLSNSEDIVTEFVLLNKEGFLSIMGGYAWDGPSGPMPDVAEAMRASLIHDALYLLMREAKLPPTSREQIDSLLRHICLEDGMEHPMAELMYQAVHLFGRPYAAPSSFKQVLTAP